MSYKLGIFGDPHVTKKVKEFTNEWNSAVLLTFREMYDRFLAEGVSIAICTGDFFDKCILEAKDVTLVNEIRSIMSSITTYILLGNHEIDSDENNILDALGDDKFIPVTSLKIINGILFIPYNVDPSTVDTDILKDKIVITHHDIYGSVLAGGKVSSSFGYDPNLFNDTKITINGHVHLRSILGKVHNIGSLFSTQFGELNEGASDYPCYYIYDVDSNNLTTIENKNSLYYVTCNKDDVNHVCNKVYNDCKVILRVLYNSSDVDVDGNIPDNVLKISRRKLLSNSLESSEVVKKSTTLDIKEVISSYIDNDTSIINDEDKSRLKSKCLSIIGD